MSTFKEFVDYLKQIGVYPEFSVIDSGVNEPECKIGKDKYLMFSSNNYLGLTQNSKVKKAGIDAIKKYGMGPGGSRVISGNVDIIKDLEKEIANLTFTEDSITFPTGYMANVGVFSAVMDSGMGELFGFGNFNSGDAVIFSDELNHGSIIDGCRLSSAKKVVFKHNNIDDLKKKIIAYPADRKMIVTEGVFSLEGEITPIDKFVEVAKENGALLMVDDAHGVGVIGENGGGVGDYFGCAKDIDILMGCMDKAFGGTGGYLAGAKSLIEYLMVSSRSSLLSSAIPTGMAGAMAESARILKKDQKDRQRMNDNADYLRNGIRELGYKILGNDNIPSLPLYVGSEKIGLEIQNKLFERKIYCQLVRWPAVPVGTARFRIIVMAQHEKSHLDAFLDALKDIKQEIKS